MKIAFVWNSLGKSFGGSGRGVGLESIIILECHLNIQMQKLVFLSQLRPLGFQKKTPINKLVLSLLPHPFPFTPILFPHVFIIQVLRNRQSHRCHQAR